MPGSDIAEEEQLDFSDPLRHLRVDDEALVPVQPPSIQRQIQNLNFGSVELQLLVDAGPGCGGIAWPAGEVLSNYLVHRGSAYLAERHVLELGSGTGLVGLVAAKLGSPKVIITDQSPLLNMMNQNVALNKLSDVVVPLELDWGKELPKLERVDMILAADCVYFEPSFPLLVETLTALSNIASQQCEILFCYKNRRKADKRFFTLLKKTFIWSDVNDDPQSAVYRREGISLLRLTPK
ncbi:hypothetical protein FRC20_002927 [Serendipita sp. 405]|nr:hypothetical protein FRC20_002927 [Serendipita sp. 405]